MKTKRKEVSVIASDISTLSKELKTAVMHMPSAYRTYAEDKLLSIDDDIQEIIGFSNAYKRLKKYGRTVCPKILLKKYEIHEIEELFWNYGIVCYVEKGVYDFQGYYLNVQGMEEEEEE